MKGLRFRIFAIPVRIEFGFWLMAAVLNFRTSNAASMIAWISCVFVSVLVHEFGHAFAFRAFGATPSITLHATGGLTQNESSTKLQPWQSALVSLAGPMAGFALGFAAEAFFRFVPPIEGKIVPIVVGYIRWTTFGWGIVNLIPVMPLDGGNLVRALLSWKDPEKGAIRSLWFSVIAGPLLALTIFVFRPEYQLMSVFLLLFVYSSGRQLFEMRKLIRDRNAGLFSTLDRAQDALKARQFSEAEALARTVIASASTANLRIAAAHIAASACVEEQRAEEALAILSPLPPTDVDPFLYGACLLASGRISDSVSYLEEALREHPSSELARQLLVSALESSGMNERAAQVRAGG